MPTPEYLYKKSLGFTNKKILKKYFNSKDEEMIVINWDLIEKYNERLSEIFSKINDAIFQDYKLNTDEFSLFLEDLNTAYNKLRNFGIVKEKFKNNGRSYENIYYNWMRGYLVTCYFKKVIAIIFDVEETDIDLLGKDNLESIESANDISGFIKDAVADLQIQTKNLHIEVQAGFSGVNDIKRSKSIEANRKFKDSQTETYITHFDLLNGRVAVINITKLEENHNISWVENPRFEGVFTTGIPNSYFLWNINNPIPDTIICEL